MLRTVLVVTQSEWLLRVLFWRLGGFLIPTFFYLPRTTFYFPFKINQIREL